MTNSAVLLQVDWDVIAKYADYPDAETAKNRFGQILDLYAHSGSACPFPPKCTPKPFVKKERDIGSGTNTRASKVTKTRKKKPKVPIGVNLFCMGDENRETSNTTQDEKSGSSDIAADILEVILLLITQYKELKKK